MHVEPGTSVAALALASLLAACSGEPAAPAPPPTPAAPDPRLAKIDDLDARLAKLETTVTKLATALERSLPPPPPDETAIYAVPIDANDPIDGEPDAPVTIVAVYEYMDPATPQLAKQLAGLAGVRVAWRYHAVHGAPAIPAGLVACAAHRERVHGKVAEALRATLYDAAGKPHPEKGALEQLRPIAVAAGLASAKLDAALPACRARIEATPKELAAIGISGPPAVIVNGRILPGLPDPAELAQRIAEARAAVEQSGLAGAAYYQQEIVAKGRTSIKSRFE